MKQTLFLTVLRDCLKKNRIALIGNAVFGLGCCCIFILYRLDLEPFLYWLILSAVFQAILLAVDYIRLWRRASERQSRMNTIISQWNRLPEPSDQTEADYQKMLTLVGENARLLQSQYQKERLELLDYYVSWVHQIKTPIAVMRLRLSEKSPDTREMEAELFRIEQYVEMALSYIRLGSETNDLVVQEYSLDELLRETVRKFASQFILRKLALDYHPTDRRIITDKKWFCLIIEQFLSNAIKYTPSGKITVCVEEREVKITDTGIGICAEDLPRIFEKGYTGVNGRIGEKSSGLGLYLAKAAADKLAFSLHAQSIPGKGSTFSVQFR